MGSMQHNHLAEIKRWERLRGWKLFVNEAKWQSANFFTSVSPRAIWSECWCIFLIVVEWPAFEFLESYTKSLTPFHPDTTWLTLMVTDQKPKRFEWIWARNRMEEIPSGPKQCTYFLSHCYDTHWTLEYVFSLTDETLDMALSIRS
jgi:hypothetical protein